MVTGRRAVLLDPDPDPVRSSERSRRTAIGADAVAVGETREDAETQELSLGVGGDAADRVIQRVVNVELDTIVRARRESLRVDEPLEMIAFGLIEHLAGARSRGARRTR